MRAGVGRLSSDLLELAIVADVDSFSKYRGQEGQVRRRARRPLPEFGKCRLTANSIGIIEAH